MKQEAIFFWWKKKNPYICGGTFVANDLCPYLEKGRKTANCFVNLLNRGLGVNLDSDFSFCWKRKNRYVCIIMETLDILVDRRWKKSTYTIGRMYLDGEFFCNTLEDRDRGLTSEMSLIEINGKKVMHETAIPSGTYEVSLDYVSPKFSQYPYYMEVCGGRLPRLLDVKGFSGVLIHVGTNASHSSGCILVGNNTSIGQLSNGKKVFEELYKRLLDAKKEGKKIMLRIV